MIEEKRRSEIESGSSEAAGLPAGVFLDNGIKQSIIMNSTLKPHRVSGDAAASGESRFEKFETERFHGTPAYAHFGQKLQVIFPLPAESSEPENLRLLLREIRESPRLEAGREEEPARGPCLPKLTPRPA